MTGRRYMVCRWSDNLLHVPVWMKLYSLKKRIDRRVICYLNTSCVIRHPKVENACIKHIRKLAKTNTGVNRIEIFESMHAEVTELLKDQNERAVLEYFNVSAWIESKIRKLSFEDTIKTIVEKC